MTDFVREGALFGAKIAFVSISLDPEHDTPEVLKDFAQFWGVKPEGWSFLTGPLEAVRDATLWGYSLRRRRMARSSIRSRCGRLLAPNGRG
jgi:protein SCO1